jgi:RNA polymerase-binding transcription factor DksA
VATDSLLFRQRLANYLRSNGLPERAVATEVLLLLPTDFLDQYEELWLRTWGAPGMSGGVRIGDPDAEVPVATKWRASTSETETRGTASVKGRGSTSKGLGVRDVRAAATKEWVDRKLRKLARELRDRMTDEGRTIRRCTGSKCRRLAEDTWNWCPTCGAPTEEWDGPND